MSKHIKKFKDFNVNESTEFNYLRFNSDSAMPGVPNVDDKSLSLNAFDKQQNMVRVAMTRINDIMFNLTGTNAFKSLRSKLALEEQDIQSLVIQKIIKNGIDYNVYVKFVIDDYEYWGVIINLFDPEADLKSEVFKDYDLYQSKEWIIKIKGLVIRTVKEWLNPEPGLYKVLKNDIICYSNETGKQLEIPVNSTVEVLRAYENKIIIINNDIRYTLKNDNYVYFNWWFEKVD